MVPSVRIVFLINVNSKGRMTGALFFIFMCHFKNNGLLVTGYSILGDPDSVF